MIRYLFHSLLFAGIFCIFLSPLPAIIEDSFSFFNAEELRQIERTQAELYQQHKIDTLIHIYEQDQTRDEILAAWKKKRTYKLRPSFLLLLNPKHSESPLLLHLSPGQFLISQNAAHNILKQTEQRLNYTTTSALELLQEALRSLPDTLSYLSSQSQLRDKNEQTLIDLKAKKKSAKFWRSIRYLLIPLGILLSILVFIVLRKLFFHLRPYHFPTITYQPRLGGSFSGGSNILITKLQATHYEE